jgi:formylglycine-generating enzyme required for sulfatase activity
MSDERAKGVYLTDRWTTEDALNFSDFRSALQTILHTAETPLTVGVFGPWGSGKTSLMRMLRQDLEGSKKSGGDSINTVWFTAWKYDREDVLWRAFILRVLNALYPREDGEGPPKEWPPPEERPKKQDLDPDDLEQVKLLQRMEQSVYRPVEWEELGERTIKWGKLISNTTLAGAEIAASFFPGAAALGKLLKLVDDKDSPERIQAAAEALSREVQAHHRDQLFHMEQFEETFAEAIKKILGGEGRLVIFVDDLDRCLPEKAVEILEAIKLFMEVPGAVFVLGMDQRVIQRGIEARYGALFRRLEKGGELPIRGDSYLQKIVQIPFYLPALAVEGLEEFIESQDEALPPMTRQVFARGLYPNPRQVKRALNIFRLLQEIARRREALEISWPLLAKTVVIQTQYPELYQLWRSYPTLVQTLEEEYTSRPTTEEELLRGRGPARLREEAAGEAKTATEESEASAQEAAAGSGGLLDDFLRERRQYARLARMLTYPPEGEIGEGWERARFAGLSRSRMAAYVRLAGAVETEPEATPAAEVPADLLELFLSGDPVKRDDAAGRLDEQEDEASGPLHEAFRANLVQRLQDPGQATSARVSAGNALARLDDPRFRADAWFLPDEPLLGFVDVPAGPFLMGSNKETDPAAEDSETPQHEVSLPPYYIARYPVTVAQFRAFVEDSGHKVTDDRSLGGTANHPVVWVTWHEAIAYCDWLTERLREWGEGTPEPLASLLRHGGNDGRPWRVILPSEAEWEKAARGDDGRIYPWGGEFDPDRANVKATEIATTSAVGCFPGGTGAYGLQDASGDVWEWTRSLWGERSDKPEYAYPYKSDDGREKLDASDSVFRVLRGGSFANSASVCRCSFRDWYYPNRNYLSRGFRVAASPFSTSDL